MKFQWFSSPHTRAFIVFGILTLTIGFGFGFFVEKKQAEALYLPVPTFRSVRERNNSRPLINPLLLCDFSDNKQSIQLLSVHQVLEQYIASQPRSQLSDISIYIRGLKPGTWLGINEDEKYSPASLLKVPTMIAAYKVAEKTPGFLSRRVTYSGLFDENQLEDIKPIKTLQPGKSYTVEELVEYMIKYSDNNARQLLHDLIDPNDLAGVYSDLGVALPSSPSEVDFMSAKTYSFFFRTLYNATYLTSEDSEHALELLSTVDFSGGVRAGVPSSTLVANKFGERTVFQADNSTVKERELHDCGMVFYPDHPYLICVMTKGKDFQYLSGVIEQISRIAYSEVANLNKNDEVTN